MLFKWVSCGCTGQHGVFSNCFTVVSSLKATQLSPPPSLAEWCSTTISTVALIKLSYFLPHRFHRHPNAKRRSTSPSTPLMELLLYSLPWHLTTVLWPNSSLILFHRRILPPSVVPVFRRDNFWGELVFCHCFSSLQLSLPTISRSLHIVLKNLRSRFIGGDAYFVTRFFGAHRRLQFYGRSMADHIHFSFQLSVYLVDNTCISLSSQLQHPCPRIQITWSNNVGKRIHVARPSNEQIFLSTCS